MTYISDASCRVCLPHFLKVGSVLFNFVVCRALLNLCFGHEMFDKFCGCGLRDGVFCMDGGNRSRLGSALSYLRTVRCSPTPQIPSISRLNREVKSSWRRTGELNLHPYFGAYFRYPSFVFLAVRVIRLASVKVAYFLRVFFYVASSSVAQI